MAFDNGEKEGGAVATQQAPDFKAALESYYKQVEDISVNIKAGQVELAGLVIEIAKAKTDLQNQYNQRVSSLGNEISVLSTQIVDLQAKADSLTQQIQDKQATKDSISLDFKLERERVDASWVELHKSIEDYKRAAVDLAQNHDENLKIRSKLAKQEHDFEVYKADVLAGIARDADLVKLDKENANKAQDEALATLIKLDSTIDQIAQDKAAFALVVANAQVLVEQAAEVDKQRIANDEASRINSAQAVTNDDDAREIKVARVALNNKDQELKAREQMVTLAEKKIN